MSEIPESTNPLDPEPVGGEQDRSEAPRSHPTIPLDPEAVAAARDRWLHSDTSQEPATTSPADVSSVTTGRVRPVVTASVLGNLLADARRHPWGAVAASGLALALVTACCWSLALRGTTSANTAPPAGQVAAVATDTPTDVATGIPYTPVPVVPVDTTPYPTDTPAPPTATPDPSQAIIDRAVSYGHQIEQCCDVQQITATYDAGAQHLVVTLTVGQPITAGLERGEDQLLCFQLQQAYWLHGHWPVAMQEIDIVIDGPVTDSYGNSSIARYAEADLTAATEANFNWQGLNDQSAWAVYDFAGFFAGL